MLPWDDTPEGRMLKDWDKDIWTYKVGISFRKSKKDDLLKTKKALRDIQQKCRSLIQTTKNNDMKEGAKVIYQKAEKIVEYIDAILTLRILLVKIKEKYDEELKALEVKGPDHPYAGYIDDVGRFIGRKTRYVLKRGDEIICFLTSDKYNLKDYYYTEVAITGFDHGKPQGKTPILIVTKMDVKGRHPWNSTE